MSLSLIQIRKVAYKIINLPTLLLPQWNKVCRQFGVEAKLLPRDVRTQWNSTFYMLEAAIAYRSVYDALTTHKDNGLRMYELSDEEWALAEQICEVLQVRLNPLLTCFQLILV